MKALVIYDSITGKIYHIIYGSDETPQGIPWMWVDIPDGAILESIDVTDSENPQPIFSYKPESDIGKLQNQVSLLSSQLEEQKAINETLQNELTNLQLAFVEMYESDTTTLKHRLLKYSKSISILKEAESWQTILFMYMLI